MSGILGISQGYHSRKDINLRCSGGMRIFFFNVFPEELSGLPPHREIKFCINVVSDTAPISMPPYRMASAELKELKE